MGDEITFGGTFEHGGCDDVTEDVRKPLAVFRDADQGAHRFEEGNSSR